MKAVAIVFLSIISSVVYGIIHDQITARVCIEYFTIGHPPIFHTDSPTLLGLGWGVIATWWVGLILGVPLAMAARLGAQPKQDAASLVRPIAILLLVMAGCALMGGIAGYSLGVNRFIFLTEPLASAIPTEKHPRFLADAGSHLASYAAGFIGGIALMGVTWRTRSAAGALTGGK